MESKTIFHLGVIFSLYLGTIQNVNGSGIVDRIRAASTTSKKIYIIENIDLNEIETNEGLANRYQFVILAFWGAVNDELERQRTLAAAARNRNEKYLRQISIPNSLLHFTAIDSQKFNTKDYLKLVELADQAAIAFREAFVDRTSNDYFAYSIHGHYFRLLLWLQYQMRYFELRSISLEDIFSENKIQSECLSINTLEELKTFGNREDKVYEYCLKIATTNGNLKDLELWVNPLNENLEEYENFLETAMETPDVIKIITSKYAEEIMMYIYTVQNMKRGIKYDHIPIADIVLDTSKKGNLYQYFRDMMLLFYKALDETIIPPSYSADMERSILLLEHFNVDETPFTSARRKTLRWWVDNLIFNGYDRAVTDLENLGEWDIRSKLCYRELIIWLVTHVEFIKAETLGESYDVTKRNITLILGKSRASIDPSVKEVEINKDGSRVHLKMNTWNNLRGICEKYSQSLLPVPE